MVQHDDGSVPARAGAEVAHPGEEGRSSGPGAPARRPGWKRRLIPILIVLLAALGIRLATFARIQDGPIPYLHHWTESDMHFFREWSREIAAGDWLSKRAGRPSHSWHDHVARRVHERSGSAEPYGPAVRDRYWSSWLGEHVFYQDALYPYLLALIRLAAGADPWPVFLMQGLLGILTALLVQRIASRLFGPVTGLVAGLMAALFGPLILFESVLLRESLITVLAVASLAAGIEALRSPERRAWALVAGALCGAAYLVKSSSLLFFIGFIGLLLHRFRFDPRRASARAGLVLLGFALCISPLVARNLAVGVPPWIGAGSGPVTFVNHNAADYRGIRGDTLSEHADEVMEESRGRFLPAALATIRTHPGFGSWLALVGEKLLAFWHWYEVPNNTSYDYFRMEARPVSLAYAGFGLLAPLALAGYLLAIRRDHAIVLAMLPLATGLLTVALFYHLSRFRVPVAVSMIPFAAFGATGLLRSIREGRRWKPAAAVVVIALGSLVVWRPLPPGFERIRVSDYGVANEIALNVARLRLAHDDLPGALAILERQLSTMPEDLGAITPGPEPGRLSPFSAALSGSYRPLHVEAAELSSGMGDAARAGHHRRRAAVLGVIERQYRRALPASPGGDG